uniref:Uncharacterized protein n=1 Tax=Euplotes aediculatus TaxID=5940 RepID=A0A8A9WN64_EUPAE|nr:hypothetical protein [Euplotes aediculatus]
MVVFRWFINFCLYWEMGYLFLNFYIHSFIYYNVFIIYFIQKIKFMYNFIYFLLYVYWFNYLVSIFYFKFAEFIWILYIQKYALYLYKSNNNINTLVWHFQKYFN